VGAGRSSGTREHNVAYGFGEPFGQHEL
jgi:hypothetical protein